MRPKITRTPDFRDFWAFWEEVFFDIFWDNKKSAKIWKNPTLWFQRSVRVVILGRPGGMRGATGEVRRG